MSPLIRQTNSFDQFFMLYGLVGIGEVPSEVVSPLMGKTEMMSAFVVSLESSNESTLMLSAIITTA